MPLKIYLCAFLKREYLREAAVCIESIRNHGKFTGPIYLFTDMPASIEGVNVIKVPCKSVPLSAGFRLKVFDHIKNLSATDDILLYLDTDIIVLKPLPSFDTITNAINVYGYPTRSQKGESFAGFLTEDPRYTELPGICSGILLFRPTQEVKDVFDITYKRYLEYIKEGRVNSCWEQPVFCMTVIEKNMYEMSLNTLVYEERDGTGMPSSAVFNHFCGLRSPTRYKKMREYVG